MAGAGVLCVCVLARSNNEQPRHATTAPYYYGPKSQMRFKDPTAVPPRRLSEYDYAQRAANISLTSYKL